LLCAGHDGFCPFSESFDDHPCRYACRRASRESSDIRLRWTARRRTLKPVQFGFGTNGCNKAILLISQITSRATPIGAICLLQPGVFRITRPCRCRRCNGPILQIRTPRINRILTTLEPFAKDHGANNLDFTWLILGLHSTALTIHRTSMLPQRLIQVLQQFYVSAIQDFLTINSASTRPSLVLRLGRTLGAPHGTSVPFTAFGLWV